MHCGPPLPCRCPCVHRGSGQLCDPCGAHREAALGIAPRLCLEGGHLGLLLAAYPETQKRVTGGVPQLFVWKLCNLNIKCHVMRQSANVTRKFYYVYCFGTLLDSRWANYCLCPYIHKRARMYLHIRVCMYVHISHVCTHTRCVPSCAVTTLCLERLAARVPQCCWPQRCRS